MFKTILVAIDGSTSNERILLFAEHLARVENAQLVVVHAYQLPDIYEWTDAYEMLREQYEVMAAEVVRDALEVLQGAQEETGAEALTDVRRGLPAEAILAAASAHNADLIVMGGRSNRNQAADLLLGSVASTVLRAATCPVLVVP
jgi:nucleotide-binding universal stress UspA family protein